MCNADKLLALTIIIFHQNKKIYDIKKIYITTT